MWFVIIFSLKKISVTWIAQPLLSILRVMRTQLGNTTRLWQFTVPGAHQVPFCTSLCNLSYYSWELWRRNRMMCGRRESKWTTVLPLCQKMRSYNLPASLLSIWKEICPVNPHSSTICQLKKPVWISSACAVSSQTTLEWKESPTLTLPYSRDESLNF